MTTRRRRREDERMGDYEKGSEGDMVSEPGMNIFSRFCQAKYNKNRRVKWKVLGERRKQNAAGTESGGSRENTRVASLQQLLHNMRGNVPS